jgi:hypothetical protein
MRSDRAPLGNAGVKCQGMDACLQAEPTPQKPWHSEPGRFVLPSVCSRPEGSARQVGQKTWLGLQYQYVRRDSDLPGRDYQLNIVQLHVAHRF